MNKNIKDFEASFRVFDRIFAVVVTEILLNVTSD